MTKRTKNIDYLYIEHKGQNYQVKIKILEKRMYCPIELFTCATGEITIENKDRRFMTKELQHAIECEYQKAMGIKHSTKLYFHDWHKRRNNAGK